MYLFFPSPPPPNDDLIIIVFKYSKPISFLKMVPSGMLPAAIIDGQLVTESNEIMQELEGEHQVL